MYPKTQVTSGLLALGMLLGGVGPAIAQPPSGIATGAPQPSGCRPVSYQVRSVPSTTGRLHGVLSATDLRLDGTVFRNGREAGTNLMFLVLHTCANGKIVRYAENPKGKVMFAPANQVFGTDGGDLTIAQALKSKSPRDEMPEPRCAPTDSEDGGTSCTSFAQWLKDSALAGQCGGIDEDTKDCSREGRQSPAGG